jgi:O-antigen ligase
MKAFIPPANALAANRDHLASVLVFCLGLLLQVSRIPARIVSMPSRLESTLFDVTLFAPFVAALLLLPKSKHPPDRLWIVATATVLSFVASTFLALLSGGSGEKVLTMVAGTVAICLFLPGSRRLADSLVASDGAPLFRGLQFGFLILTLYLYQDGAYTSQKFNSDLANLGFIDTGGIYRNVVTMLGGMALCASLSDISPRKLPPWPALVLDLVVAGAVLYLTFRIPGKGAWVSAGVVSTVFLLLMIQARRPGLVLLIVGGVIAISPLVYDRLGRYFQLYLSDASSQGFTGRTAFWHYAWKVINDRGSYLMGLGFDSAFGTSYIFGVAHFHNEFVNALYCGGVVGVTLLTIWIAFYLFRVVRGAASAVVSENGRLMVFCCLYGAFTASRLGTEVPITNFMEPLPLWILCTAVVAVATGNVTAPKSGLVGSRWGHLVAAPGRPKGVRARVGG